MFGDFLPWIFRLMVSASAIVAAEAPEAFSAPMTLVAVLFNGSKANSRVFSALAKGIFCTLTSSMVDFAAACREFRAVSRMLGFDGL